MTDFPVPRRDVSDQTLPGRELINDSRPGRVWSVTSRLGTGKSATFFYSVGAPNPPPPQPQPDLDALLSNRFRKATGVPSASCRKDLSVSGYELRRGEGRARYKGVLSRL